MSKLQNLTNQLNEVRTRLFAIPTEIGRLRDRIATRELEAEKAADLAVRSRYDESITPAHPKMDMKEAQASRTKLTQMLHALIAEQGSSQRLFDRLKLEVQNEQSRIDRQVHDRLAKDYKDQFPTLTQEVRELLAQWLVANSYATSVGINQLPLAEVILRRLETENGHISKRASAIIDEKTKQLKEEA